MPVSSLTPYVWNLLWQTFIPINGSVQVGSPTSIGARHLAEKWLADKTPFQVFDRLLQHEGIIGYSIHLIHLVNDLNLKPE